MFKLVVLACLVACGSAQFLASPYAYGAFGTPYLAPYAGNYRGPLSLAPGQPANILGADGRPLDTLDVNLDKSAHLTAKAFAGSGIHLLKKRSIAAPIVAPLSTISYHGAPLIRSPLAYSAPITTYGHFASPYYGYGAPLIHAL